MPRVLHVSVTATSATRKTFEQTLKSGVKGTRVQGRVTTSRNGTGFQVIAEYLLKFDFVFQSLINTIFIKTVIVVSLY